MRRLMLFGFLAVGLTAVMTMVVVAQRPEREPTRDGDAQRREGDAPRDGDGRRREATEGRRPPRPPRPPLEVALDADDDGEISAGEMENAVAALKKLDKNGDGKLTGDEFRPPRPPRDGGPEAARPPRGAGDRRDPPPREGDGREEPNAGRRGRRPPPPPPPPPADDEAESPPPRDKD